MVTQRNLQELIAFRSEGARVLSLYLDTDLNRQPKDKCKLVLREKLSAVADTCLSSDLERVERFFEYEYDWQGLSVALFSCQERDFWHAYTINAPIRDMVFCATEPYVKPLVEVLGEYGSFAVVLVDQTGARLFAVQQGEIREEDEIVGKVVKRHKQGGRSRTTFQRKTDMQVLHNMKIAAEAATEFCQGEACQGMVLAGSESVLTQFAEMLPRHLQKEVVGSITADMATPSSVILSRAMELWQARKREQEGELVEQLVTAAAKGEPAALGLADTLYAVRQGQVHILLVERDYEAPGVRCDACGYVGVAGEQKCLFCGGVVQPVDNAVDLAVHNTLASGGTALVLADNERLAEAGHIGAILRY